MGKYIEQCKVLSNVKKAKDVWQITVQTDKIAKESNPGQFVEISIAENTSELLKRPFGVFATNGNELSLLYKVKGKVTTQMTKLIAGNSLSVVGPLGNEFTINEKKKVLLLGGGIGVAPVYFLKQALEAKGNVVHLLYGVRDRAELVDLETMNVINHVDEEEGFFACDRLEALINNLQIDELKVCGPMPLMKESAKVAKRLGVNVELSLEEKMACGFGACVGCVIQTQDGYKRVCADGPVFEGEYIKW
jgi:dihydroorotate dehydrogenase electron transfer subunit